MSIVYVYDPISFKYVGPSNTPNPNSLEQDPNLIDWSDLPDHYVIYYDKEFKCWDKSKSFVGRVYWHKETKEQFICPTVYWPADRNLNEYTKLEPPSKGYSVFEGNSWVIQFNRISEFVRKQLSIKINKYLANKISSINPIAVLYRGAFASIYTQGLPVPAYLRGAITGDNIDEQCTISIKESEELSNSIGRLYATLSEFDYDLAQIPKNNAYETLALSLLDQYTLKVNNL